MFLKNQTWTRALPNATLHEILIGKKPDLSNIHSWGARVWIHNAKGSKLDRRAKEGRWIGYEESRGHHIYWEAKKSVTIERSITFIPTEVDIWIGNVPIEGEMEDFEEILEEVNEGNQPILSKIEYLANDSNHPNRPQAEEMSDNEVPESSEHVQPEIIAEEDTGG